jgi:hypothetical protein
VPAPVPEVRVTNRVPPPAPAAEEPVDDDTRLFEPEGSAEGCASGECLPGEEPKPAAVAAKVAPSAASLSIAAGATRWKNAVDAVRTAFPRHGKSLSFARLISISPGEVRVSFGSANSFHRATVLGSARLDVEKILTQVLGSPHKLAEELSQEAWTNAPRSIAELEADDRMMRERNIDGRARDSDAVKSILKYLGGNVEHVQVLDAPAATEEPLAPPPEDEP